MQRLNHQKLRLAGVLMLNTVATLMVIGLAFDIQIVTKQSSTVYLITHGTTSQQLKNIGTQQTVFVMRPAFKTKPDNNIFDVAIEIDNPSQIFSQQGTFQQLHVLGDGLSSHQWQDLQLLMGEKFSDISVVFSASKPRLGLVDLSWPRELVVGEFVEISGLLQGTDEALAADNIYQLSLRDPAGEVIHTTSIKPSERFRLSFPATSIGQWVYQLRLSKNNDSIIFADEPIALSVVKPTPLRILIKQSSPSFETRQLKNWAAEFGSQITVLTQISKVKEIRQSINLNDSELEQSPPPFSAQSLDIFDWLVIDGRALLTLNKQQMNALHAAVKKGLGVYIIADNELVKAWPVPLMDWLSEIDIQPLELANYSSIPIWANSQIDRAMPLVKAKVTPSSDISLVQNNAGAILVSRSKIGLGQVAVSLINATYGWQTAGLTEQYSHFWQSVIYQLARPKQPPYWLKAKDNSLSLVNHRKQRCLLGVTTTGLTTQNQSPQPLILTQDLVQSDQYCLSIWPTIDGWQKLEWSEKNELTAMQDSNQLKLNTWFYTYENQDWSQWQQNINHQASHKIAQQHNTEIIEQNSSQSLSKAWLWGLLTMSMSLLWLERKLF
jgi:hypothetical protein